MAESVDINNSNFDIRYTEEKDVDYLKRWVSTPTVLKRLPFSEGKELDNSVVGWMSFAPYRCTITATWKERPVGMAILYLMPYRKLAHHCVCQVVVDPAHQRQGVGGALIKNLKHLAKNYFHLEWIQFEVFEGNPLIELLKKNDFYEAVKMDRYAKVEGRYLARSIMECDIRMVKQAVNPCVKGYDEPWPSTSKALFPSPPQRELTLRPIVEEDAPFLKNCLNDERILPWFPMQDEREIDDSVRMWMGSSLQGGGVMALWNGEPCGLANLYLPYYKKFNHQCLLSIVVGEEFRGQGVGAALIEEIMKLAKEKFQIEFLHLEVYQGNPAIHLYERAGFIIYGIDRHFIKEKEGAYRAKILMQRDL